MQWTLHTCVHVFGDFEVHIDEKYTKLAKPNQAVSGEGNYDLDFGGSYMLNITRNQKVVSLKVNFHK
jgi:hypothetical protein